MRRKKIAIFPMVCSICATLPSVSLQCCSSPTIKKNSITLKIIGDGTIKTTFLGNIINGTKLSELEDQINPIPKEGWEFDGYYVGEKKINDGYEITNNLNLTVFFKRLSKKIVIDFKTTGMGTIETTSLRGIISGTKLSDLESKINPRPAEGWRFDGYYVNGEKIIKPDEYLIKENVEILVAFMGMHTITLKTLGNGTIETTFFKDIDNGTKLSELENQINPTPKEGWEFAGYYIDGRLIQRDYEIVDNTVITVKFAFQTHTNCFEYTYNFTDHTATIQNCISKTQLGENVIIPKVVENSGIFFTVTHIADFAFFSIDDLISVTFPDSIVSIGSYAFAICQNLKSVVLPDSVHSIGNNAFEYCQAFTSFTIPKYVTRIETRAFKDCSSLTSITIPDSVTFIDDQAFYGCYNLKDFNQGFKFTGFSDQWYQIIRSENWDDGIYAKTIECSDIICNLNDDESQLKMLNYKFHDASRTATVLGTISRFNSYSNVFIPKTVYHNKTNYTVTSIAECAFQDCHNVLKSVFFPDSITFIGVNAFAGCGDITDTSGPGGSFGFNFAGRSEQWRLVLRFNTLWHSDTPANRIKCLDSSCLLDDSSTPANCFRFNYFEKENKATVIGYNSNLPIHICIPKYVEHNGSIYNVTSIDCRSFVNCYWLKTLSIPDSIISINESAFENCSSLDSVIIPSSVCFISSFAFHLCSSIIDQTPAKRFYSFNYTGTIDEWKQVVCSKSWRDGTPATRIQCSDGICPLD